jgi:hypothetical protein
LTQQPVGMIGTSDDVRTYELCRSTNLALFNAKEVTAPGLTNGGEYQFTVASRNAAGMS